MNELLGYTIGQVSAIAPLGRTSVYAAINKGELRAVKRGKRTIVLRDDLVRYLQSLPAIKAKQCDPPDGDGEKPCGRKRAVS